MTTFADTLALLAADTITIDGSVAELTRQAYYNQYTSWINTGQFVPILYFNVTNTSVNISNTEELNILSTDILTATDWIVINANNS